MSNSGRLISIQTGRVVPLQPLAGGAPLAVRSAIGKTLVSTLDAPLRVAALKLGLAGDEQADPAVHGGLEKAIYAYPRVHYALWQQLLGRDEPLPPGSLGENLLIEGLVEGDLWVGDQLQVANCLFTVTSPRRPCHKLNAVLGYSKAGREMLLRGLTGWYLSVDQTGEIAAGDALRLLPGPRRVSLLERVQQMTRRVDLD